jgi:magnesium transporter
MLDAIVDNYFLVLEKLGEEIEVIEEVLVSNPTRAALSAIHDLKRDLLFMRKVVWPLREVVNLLEMGDSTLVRDSTGVYLRDVYDHVIQAVDIIETFQDILSSNLDVYLSSISNRLNEVMKVLTIITTIFMPLTFVTGLYGMNFVHMPLLQSTWGLPIVLSVMLLLVVGMLMYFRRKRWI